METRNVKLSIEKAKEFYVKGGEFKDLALSAFTVEELTRKELPNTWEEYKSCWAKRRKGIRLSDMSEVELDNFAVTDSFVYAHNALTRLHLLRDCYRQGWNPETTKNHFSILHYKGEKECRIIGLSDYLSPLTFPTYEIAKKFLDNFEDLIKQAGDLI